MAKKRRDVRDSDGLLVAQEQLKSNDSDSQFLKGWFTVLAKC